MNSLENKMVETLIDLKKNYHVCSVKAEFEAEGTSFEEALRLKNITNKAGLDLTIKIGGCEALKDMYETKIMGAKSIVAPMVETSYALKKFINATKTAFNEEERKNIEFFINIETITGYKNFDEIINSQETKDISGIVFGRMDMTGSMGIPREEVDSEEIFNFAHNLALKTSEYGKKLIIGGGVSINSLPFFEKLPENSLNKFETRKIIFDACALKKKNIKDGIFKAIEFELMWLKNKQDYGMLYNQDKQRIIMLESLQNKKKYLLV